MAEQVKQKDRAKQEYIETDLTLEEIAEKYGFSIGGLKTWSRREGWRALRVKRRMESLSKEIAVQAKDIRTFLYGEIVSGDIEGKALTELVSSWLQLTAIEPQDELVDRESILEDDPE